MYRTSDELLDLLAAIYRQALDDAQKGRQDAIDWLDHSAPEIFDTYIPSKNGLGAIDWRRMLSMPSGKVDNCSEN